MIINFLGCNSEGPVKVKLDEIIDFSGIERYIDTPVKRYSSGMYLRLAFAVGAHLNPEILLIDEVLAVGDFRFQKRCLDQIMKLNKMGKTTLFVSHHLPSVQEICNRGICRQGIYRPLRTTGNRQRWSLHHLAILYACD